LKPFRRRPYRGYLYIACAAALWGVAATLGRAAFTGRVLGSAQVLRPIDPLILSQCRTTFSFLIFFVALAWKRGLASLRLPWREVWKIALLGLLGVAASNYLYYLAIQRTNVATAIIVQYTAPIWVLLYAVASGAQKFTAQRVIAVALAILGIAMVIGLFSGRHIDLDKIGVVAALLAAFSYAFYNIAGYDLVERIDRWTVLLYATLSASMFWIFVNPPGKIVSEHYSSGQWLFLLVFAIVSMLGPFSFYFAGLQHLEPTRAIVVSCLEPVFSILIAAAALGEVIHFSQAVGIGMVLAGILVTQRPDRHSVKMGREIAPIQ
jgi:drug/metabolite transporter (DMT)-like permease